MQKAFKKIFLQSYLKFIIVQKMLKLGHKTLLKNFEHKRIDCIALVI